MFSYRHHAAAIMAVAMALGAAMVVWGLSAQPGGALLLGRDFNECNLGGCWTVFQADSAGHARSADASAPTVPAQASVLQLLSHFFEGGDDRVSSKHDLGSGRTVPRKSLAELHMFRLQGAQVHHSAMVSMW